MRSALLKPSTRLNAGARPVQGARPFGIVGPKHQSALVIAGAAPAEGASAVAVADSQATHEHVPAVASEPVNVAAPEAGAKKQRKGGKNRERKGAQPTAREVIENRLKSLLAGEAVGLSMAATTSDVAVGFKGLRPLSDELRRKQQTLLFFPSTSQQQQPAEAAAAPEAGAAAAEASSAEAAAPSGPQRNLELALVAVPRFRAPSADVTLRVGARSDVATMSRMLTRALIQSSAVAIHAAGPGAALVALQAAAAARRNLSSSKQVDLAFTLEYLRVPATTAGPNGAAAEEGGKAAAAAAAPEAAAGSAEGSAAGEPKTSILQFSFYKRALPTPEVVVADFATTRAGRALSTLLVSLLAERREVELVLASKDAVFGMQALARAVRECWSSNKASVGVFLTSLETDASVSDADAATPTGLSPAGPGTRPFTARLQLRRIPGAPNLVAASGGGRQRQSLLGAPLGDVKRDTPIAGLAAAMNRELDSAGVYSVLPQEGVCVARALLALWEAQRGRGAAYRANAPAAAGTASDASDPSAPPASSLLQIAIVPETQLEGSAAAPAEAPGTQAGSESDQEGAEGARRRRAANMRATVLHMVEVTPVLASTLRIKDGAVVPISGGEQLAQLSKAVVLRNRMYGGRRDATALVMTPLLDDAGALAVKMQYVPAARVADLPPPPPPRGTAASEAATEEEALVIAGPEAGAGAVGSGIAATRPSSTGSIAAAAAAAAAARFFADPSPPPADAFAAGYMTDDEYGIGAEAGAFIPGQMPAADEEEVAAKPAAEAKAAAAPAVAPAPAAPAVSSGAAAGADTDKPKSPWVLYVSPKTASLNLAMSVVAETCKPWDRLSPAWLRVPCKPDVLATAGLAVAMAQAQVQERADVTLQVVPVLERRRDERGRPGNYLTWRLIKSGPGAEPGAAAAAVAARANKAGTRKSGNRSANGTRNGGGDKDVPVGPSPAAMAAAAAAAAKALADNDKIAKGKLW